MTKSNLKGLAAALGILALPMPVMAQDADVPTQIVDVMNKLFGVHPGFRANHAKGILVEGGFTATPEAAELSKAAIFDPKDAAAKAPDFLMDELPARLKDGPVTFHLKAQLAEPGDQTRDGSKPWPDDRKVVDLGALTIDRAVPDSLEAQKKLLFLPTSLIDGIEESDDPLPDVRSAAYAVSFSRRNP